MLVREKAWLGLVFLKTGRIFIRKQRFIINPVVFHLVRTGSLLPAPGCRNAWIKSITVHICCLENKVVSLTVGGDKCSCCPLPLFPVHPTHSPLPRHQTPAAFHLQTPDGSLSLPFPSRPLGPLPVPASAWRGQPSLYLSGLFLIHPGSAILPAGYLHPSHTSSSFPPTFLFFTLRRAGQPVCLPHPPRRRSSGHGPFPLPTPATRWRPHSAFSFGLPGLGNSAVSNWKDLDAGQGFLVHPPLGSATCLSFQTLTPLSLSLRQGSECLLSPHFQSLAGLASFFLPGSPPPPS